MRCPRKPTRASQHDTLATILNISDAIHALEEVRARLVHHMDSPTPETKRWILQLLDTRITPKDEELLISIDVRSSAVQNEGADSVHNTSMLYSCA